MMCVCEGGLCKQHESRTILSDLPVLKTGITLVVGRSPVLKWDIYRSNPIISLCQKFIKISPFDLLSGDVGHSRENRAKSFLIFHIVLAVAKQ